MNDLIGREQGPRSDATGFRITLDQTSSAPVYEQIMNSVTSAITSGELVAGSKLPTVRALAGDLGLATNTVAKAYRQLEKEGHVETQGRKGTIVRGCGCPSELQALMDEFIARARVAGLGPDEMIGLVRREIDRTSNS